MDSCVGESLLSIGVFLQSSNPRYGSVLSFLALLSRRLAICTDFSARLFDCDLQLIANNCSFRNLENELIRERIVHSNDKKQQLLRVQGPTMDKAVAHDMQMNDLNIHSVPIRARK